MVLPHDKNKIIHIIGDEYSSKIAERISLLKKNIRDIDINVSTGKVVDFRAKEILEQRFFKSKWLLDYLY